MNQKDLKSIIWCLEKKKVFENKRQPKVYSHRKYTVDMQIDGPDEPYWSDQTYSTLILKSRLFWVQGPYAFTDDRILSFDHT